jgi:ZIP family zinc transporter
MGPPIALSGLDLLLLSIGAATGAATLVGGLLTLKFRRHIPLFIGFSAGAVIGVALFDLLPESVRLSRASHWPDATFSLLGLGFAGYMLIERALKTAADFRRGHLGPASLTLHSLFDGVGIGLAFQVAPAVGVVVAVAVLAHDFSDGVNTVTLSFSGGGDAARARGWLVADAVAPIIGIAVTRLFRVSEGALGLVTALFCGFFLYIGASELTPESYRSLPRLWTSAATLLGMMSIWAVVRLAGG